MSKNDLIESLSEKLADYHEGKYHPINSAHVEKWINQFDASDQLTILRELDRIFDNFYISREGVKVALKSFLLDDRISGNNNKKINIMNTCFLRIQKSGNSQNELLDIVDEILYEEFDITTTQCKSSKQFIYIDDCIFTGNKFRYDVVPWIKSNSFCHNSVLNTYHIGIHSQGYKYANNLILQAANKYGLNVSNWFCIEINNCRRHGVKPETLWPSEISGDFSVDCYCERVRENCRINGWQDNLFRCYNNGKETLFSDENSREIVERAFLKIGARLVMTAENPAPSMRPLGFEKLESLGFGTFFVTYRNIANNCPLALWYGDPSYSSGPLSLWYPLFFRKTQTTQTEIDKEDIF